MKRPALALGLSIALTNLAVGGPLSREAHGELGEDRRQLLTDDTRVEPKDESVLPAAKRYLEAVKTKRQERVIPQLAIPFTHWLARPGYSPESSAYCFNQHRFVDEHEGMPGAPTCQSTAFAAYVDRLIEALTAETVVATLAAIEAKTGPLTGPLRSLFRRLQHHRFVALKIDVPDGPMRLVLALRTNGSKTVVDGVYAELPKHARPRTPPKDGKPVAPFEE